MKSLTLQSLDVQGNIIQESELTIQNQDKLIINAPVNATRELIHNVHVHTSKCLQSSETPILTLPHGFKLQVLKTKGD